MTITHLQQKVFTNALMFSFRSNFFIRLLHSFHDKSQVIVPESSENFCTWLQRVVCGKSDVWMVNGSIGSTRVHHHHLWSISEWHSIIPENVNLHLHEFVSQSERQLAKCSCKNVKRRLRHQDIPEEVFPAA